MCNMQRLSCCVCLSVFVVCAAVSLCAQVWRAASRSPASNLTLLEGMCEGRREQAHLLGFNSYSHYKAYGAR